MRRFWLIFAQAVTVSLAILFVVTSLRPDLLRLSGPGSVGRTGSATGFVSFAPGVAHAAPSVVNVYTSKNVRTPLLPLQSDGTRHRPDKNANNPHASQTSTSLGSGVIVSKDGYILTNYHVVQAADAIEIALADGRQDTAKVVGADPETDLAVVKLSTLRDLPIATLGLDRDLQVGDVVLAIGNPFGVGQTTTQGIVSALGRNGLGLNTYESFIQTDAAINPGNSGGALIDAEGRLVGINTAIYSESGGSLGIGFATPIHIASKVMDDIVKTGSVKRGWLGVEPQDITPELAKAFQLKHDARGVIIAGVMRDGPAGRAGLKVGDIVLTINGLAVTNTTMTLAKIAQIPPGERATLGVLRAGQPRELPVVVGTRPVEPR